MKSAHICLYKKSQKSSGDTGQTITRRHTTKKWGCTSHILSAAPRICNLEALDIFYLISTPKHPLLLLFQQNGHIVPLRSHVKHRQHFGPFRYGKNTLIVSLYYIDL